MKKQTTASVLWIISIIFLIIGIVAEGLFLMFLGLIVGIACLALGLYFFIKNRKLSNDALAENNSNSEEIKYDAELIDVNDFKTSDQLSEENPKEKDYNTVLNKMEFELYDSFTAIDFETASSAYYSACAIGIVRYENNEIKDKEYFLIQPPDNFYEKENIDIHGITPGDTKDAEIFPFVWERIKHLFKNTYIVAHNANFDMSVLKSALNYYNMEMPNFFYFCSIPVSRLNIAFTDKGVGRSLKDRCDYYNIPLDNHHNALADAEACAKLVQYAYVNNKRLYKSFGTFLKLRVECKLFEDVVLKNIFAKAKFKTTNVTELKESINIINPDNDFVGNTFVFTGQLSRMTREQAYVKVVERGGDVKNTMSKAVTYLVSTQEAMTTKIKQALELQQKGHEVKIIDEDQFMLMLEN